MSWWTENVENSQKDIDKLDAILQANTFYAKKDIKIFERFNRFGFFNPYDSLTGCREYLFFVKPDLHIFNNKNTAALNPELGGKVKTDSKGNAIGNDEGGLSIFVDAFRRYKPVLKQLQASVNTEKPFVNLLSNMVASKLDLPGISADSIETARNIYGSVISYRQNSIKSDTDFEFNLEFKDTKYLDVYMFFKLYDEYERKKFYGEITPPDMSYILNRIIHDQMAIYKFIVNDDGESLIYWAKLTGVYPTSVPRDSFSDLGAGEIKFSVSFKAAFVEDMNPDILTDFSRIVTYTNNKTLPIYNTDIGAVNGEWSVSPYIAYNNSLDIKGQSSKLPWKLKWRRAEADDDNE